MNHSPSASEQSALDDLLERHVFEPVTFRLSSTMLEKSIIDANQGFQALLARAGLVEFGAIGQGRENGVELDTLVVSNDAISKVKTSFYRPRTKHGDPRFWISKLGQKMSSGALLVLIVSEDGRLIALDMSTPIEQLKRLLGTLLPPRYDDFRKVQEVLRILRGRIEEIQRRGWVRTTRSGDTGIGHTFETLLGIQANSSKDPDYGGVELKSRRVGGNRSSGKLVTLFSKTPIWGNIDRGGDLLRRAGRVDANTGRKQLYCTITTNANSFDLKLDVNSEARRIDILHSQLPTVYYDFGTIQACLTKKHADTLFVSAEARGSGSNEEFRFAQVQYCSQPSFTRYLDLVNTDMVSLDFTLSEKPSGAPRDHGYLWRIREHRLNDLFAYQRRLL